MKNTDKMSFLIACSIVFFIMLMNTHNDMINTRTIFLQSQDEIYTEIYKDPKTMFKQPEIIEQPEISIETPEITEQTQHININSMCYEILRLTNIERTNKGVDELIWDENLAYAAQIRAAESATHWSHMRPDGSAWWTINEPIMNGENLVKEISSAEEAVELLMNSPSHAYNILDEGFKTIGIGIYIDEQGNYYVAQEFG